MPRIVDHTQRRNEIADALLNIVSNVDVQSVTIRAVAAEAGYSTGVISHYYSDKNSLLLGGLRRAAHLLGVYNKKALADSNGLSAVRLLLEGSIPIDKFRLAICRVFFFFYAEAGLACNKELSLEIQSYLNDWRAAVSKALKQAQGTGEVSKDTDTRSLAKDLTGLADGLSMHALLDPMVLSYLQDNSPVSEWLHRISKSDVSLKEPDF